MSPDLELINAALTALRGDATLVGMVPATRFFERVPEKPKPDYPYVAVGPTETTPDDVECMDAEEIAFQLDVYSAGASGAYSSEECRRIVDRIKRVLHNAELVLTENALVTLTFERKRILREEGVVNHGVVQFLATVETPA